MKVISNSLAGWSLELMCKGCNSLLEIETGDVRCSPKHRYSYANRHKDDRYSYHIICPVCDSRCMLENLPKPVQIKATNRKDDKFPDFVEQPHTDDFYRVGNDDDIRYDD